MLSIVTADVESSSTEFQELIPNPTNVEIAVERCPTSLLKTPQYGAEMDFEAKAF